MEEEEQSLVEGVREVAYQLGAEEPTDLGDTFQTCLADDKYIIW